MIRRKNKSDKYLTAGECVVLLNVNLSMFYRQLKLGKIKGAVRIGRVWRINRERFMMFLAEGK